MPKLRRLSGKEVIKVLRRYGFAVIRQRGSHARLEVIDADGNEHRLTVPVHGNKPLRTGTLLGIYREACRFVPEDDLRPHFYTD